MDKIKKEKAKELVNKMSLEEKAKLCGGKDFWTLNGIERLNLPSIMVTDGPHGLRKQAAASDHLGLNQSVKSTCFPPACLSAASWDPDLLYKMGEAIGEECIAENVAIILGPGINIKRSPLCGRNFEYFSEDPLLAGKLAASLTKGIQSKGIGTSLKHFACNNQEKARLTSNSVVDERTLREIYLSAFEEVVKSAQPDTVMCSYNMINDEYACQNKMLLTDILRDEWGFNGLVMTDWGAMSDRVKALNAGLDLEMPGPCKDNEEYIIEAVKKGVIKEDTLDTACIRIVASILKALEIKHVDYSVSKHHALAREIASNSMILLKNEDTYLPLKKEKSYAIIGGFAKSPRYQGAGSSKINPHIIDNPFEELQKMGYELSYAKGYDNITGETDQNLINEAILASEGKEAAIVFVGLPDSYESEGFDRTTLNLPEGHNKLITALIENNTKVIVVLLCGSPVIMPWKDKVNSILLSYLGGEATGGAIADILSGKISPSGCLPESFPCRLEDTPCYGNFATNDRDVLYKECILVGYRYYDYYEKKVAFPFGYGLSYTTFKYDNPQFKNCSLSVKVTNTGNIDSAHVVQVYISKPESKIFRAKKQLAGFKKGFIEAGKSTLVEIPINDRAFSYFNVKAHCWEIESGAYLLSVGDNQIEIIREGVENPYSAITARNINCSNKEYASLFGGQLPLIKASNLVTIDTPIKEAIKTAEGKRLLTPYIEESSKNANPKDDVSNMMQAMLMDSPLRILWMFKPRTTLAEVKDIVSKINASNNN